MPMGRKVRARAARLIAASLIALVACAPPESASAPVPAPDVAPTVPAPAPGPGPEPAPPRASGPATAPAPAGADLAVHFLDVGQGDATLLVHTDVTMLIDTGRFDRSDVPPLLRRYGVERLDLVVITHPHADHIGQFEDVMAAFPVDEVWWSGATATSRTFERAVTALGASTALYEEPRAGAVTTVGPLGIEILHPAAADPLRDLNDASIAMRITYGAFRMVITGDAERVSEARMLGRFPDRLDADLLRLGHHGSSTSTTPELLDAVAPSVAVYSAGAENQYGHPHEEVVARVVGRGIRLYGTDTHGTITVVTDGTSFDVRTER